MKLTVRTIHQIVFVLYIYEVKFFKLLQAIAYCNIDDVSTELFSNSPKSKCEMVKIHKEIAL